MIVKNEERFLAQCLESAKDAVDEIVVVDTGSTDRTMEIAKSYGAAVIERLWRDDFAWARNQALEAATKRWILILDADEELMPESKPALAQLKGVPAEHTALWARIYNKADDYRGTGAMSHALVRVFPNAEEIRYSGLIHEFPTIGGDRNGLRAVNSPVGIVHHGYVKEIVHQREKGARNLAIVRAAAEKDPHEPFHWFNLGTTAFLVDDFETARDALERMHEMVGNEKRGFMPNGLAVLAETYCDKLGEPEKGEAVARDALEISPHYANAHFQLGKALVAQGRFDEAREAYLAAIDDGNYATQQFVIDDQVYIWKAHSEMGSSYVLQKDDERAVEWFEKGLKNSPNAEPLHINRARALERLERLDEAGDGYRGVYELHRSEEAAIEYVNFLLRRRRDREALAIIDESYPSCKPAKAVALLLAGAAIAQRQGSSEDIHYLEAAAALAPGSADVLNPLEALLRERGRAGEISALVEAENAVPPQSPADFARRARRAIEEQRYVDGRELARQGLGFAPDDALLAYTLAAALSKTGDEAGALEVLESAGEAGDELTVSIFTLRAGLLRNAGRLPEGLECVERALQIAPQNVDAILTHASLMQASGSDAGYEASLRRAFEIDKMRVALELSSFYLRNQRFAEAATVADAALQR